VAKLGEEGRGVRILYGGSVKPGNAAELMAIAQTGS
jgi:triosephosphate isomerase